MELKTTHDIVKSILKNSEDARNSDKKIYVLVVKHLHPEMVNRPFAEVIMSDDIPSFETVRRTRQKLQERYEELRAADKVQDYRSCREEKFRDYAIDKIC